MINKKILAFAMATSFASLSSHAAEFQFSSVKRDASGVTNEQKKNNVGQYKEIIASGYGVTEEKARKNAFRAAIQQYVGVVIDSETQMKNGDLLKDNILTASSGYIQEFETLSVNNDEGLFEVEIKALVKSQQLFDKIKALNIDVIEISGMKNIQARIETKLESNKDLAKMLDKPIKEFLSNESLMDMLTIKIIDAKVLEDKAKDGKVPFHINYQLGIDYAVYENKVEKLEQTFKNLGAKLIPRVDLPFKKSGRLMLKNITKIRPFYKKTKRSIFIMKKYGIGFKTDIWEFPKIPEKQSIFNKNTFFLLITFK